MKISENYSHTLLASYGGYITQAIVNNFAPLLFLTFQKAYRIPLSKITLLVAINFCIQLFVDLVSAKAVDRVGYRASIVFAHVCAGVGLAGLGIFPFLFKDPYVGLLLAIFLYAIGGGIIEVLISPIVEACPTERKSAAMSLLHSFYCWGHMFVVIVTTVFFALVGIDQWRILTIVWAALPLLNAVYFCVVPIASLTPDGKRTSLRSLLSSKAFWVFVLVMVCAGASEQGMSQWASAFAESGLKVPKAVGDLSGPCLFAFMMGLSRVFYSRLSERIDLLRFMAVSCALCVISYLLAAFSPFPLLSFFGCALCGLSVGILWPGTFSLASRKLPRGGTAMFAFLALAGDLGCASGPTVVGFVSNAYNDNLKIGLFSAIVFPSLLIMGLRLCRKIAEPD